MAKHPLTGVPKTKAHKEKISKALKRHHSKHKKRSAAHGKGDDMWIQDAIKKRGALRMAAKRKGLIHGDEKLSETDLNVMEHSRNPTLRKRAQLADNLKHIREKKSRALKGRN